MSTLPCPRIAYPGIAYPGIAYRSALDMVRLVQRKGLSA